MMVPARAVALGLIAGCTASPRPGEPPRARHLGLAPVVQEPDPSVRPDASAPPAPATAHLTFLGRERGRPPMSRLTVDASLRNPGGRARWFLLPASTAEGQRPIATSAFGASTWSFPGTGDVVVAEFQGAASFYAIELPPDAQVELRALTIRLAGEPQTDPLSLEVIVADGFTVGGQPPSTWTQIAATCEPRADATRTGATRVSDYTTPDLAAVPIEVQGADALTVPLAITP
jgi:hypothetical protein